MAAGPSLRSNPGPGGAVLSAQGDWTAAHACDLERLARAPFAPVGKLTISIESVDRLDTFGVWALERLRRCAAEAGVDAQLAIPQDARADLFAGVEKALSRAPPQVARGDEVETEKGECHAE